MHTCDCLISNTQQIPQKIALIQGDYRCSWEKLYGRVARLAGGFRGLGVDSGSTVGILSENSFRYIESTYAIQFLAGIAVPLNHRWTAEEIEYALVDAEVATLIVDQAMLPLAQSLSQKVTDKLTLVYAEEGIAADGFVAYEDLIANAERVSIASVPADTTASIYYTGGTTGRSKGVMLSHANHVSHTLAFLDSTAFPECDNYLHAAPMFHIADSLFVYATTMVGATHVVIPRFEPAACARAITDFEISDIILVPTMIQMMLNSEESIRNSLGNLKRLFYGASPMPEAALTQLLELFPALRLHQLYGQSESSPVLTVMPPEWHGLEPRKKDKSRSAGLPMKGTEIAIVDTNDRQLPCDEVGEIVARGPQVMIGYLGMPDTTEETLRGGWLHTGDAGYIDDDGFLFITDRIKDMIITGGENVYSVEVEQAIYQFEGVAQCAVIGEPDEKWGERVHAVVVPKAGAEINIDALAAHCKQSLSDYKRPREFTVRSEPLPVSGAGKILKRELRTT